MSNMSQCVKSKAKVGSIIHQNGNVYELVPPEGGWGYFACLSVILTVITTSAHHPVFGMIYNGFLEQQKEGSSGIAVFLGVYSMTLALSGIFASLLLKYLSLRQAGLIGAGLYCIGMFLGIFIQSVTHMILILGLLQPAGIGIMLSTTYTSFNSYFVQKRVFVLSLSKLIIGIGFMMAPILTEISMQKYGFRGTLALIAAIDFHCILAMVLLQPVEWHLVKRKVADKSDEKLLQENEVIQEKYTEHLDDDGEPCSAGGADEQDRSETPKDRLYGNKTYSRIDGEERENANFVPALRAASVISLGNFTNAILEPLPATQNVNGKWKAIIDYLDLSLFKDPIYCNIIFGTSIAVFSDLQFFFYLPLMLYKIGWSNNKVAFALSLVAASDMLGRLSLAVFGRFKTVPSRNIFLTGVIFVFGTRILFETCTNEWMMMGLISLLGYFRSFSYVTQILVVADHVPIKRYPAAYALLLVIWGIISLTVGTTLGRIRDYTQSYNMVFYILTVMLLLCVIPWLLEFHLIGKKNKRAVVT